MAGAIATKQTIEAQIASVCRRRRPVPRPQLTEAQVELDKTMVRAGVDGILEQFTLRKGDVVNPLLRPAGVLVPTEAGRWGLIAGFNQLEAQVMKVGMVAEVTCISMPMTIIPMVVTNVQDLIATGQVRASDQLIDAQQATARVPSRSTSSRCSRDGFEGIPPGSSCIANAYTSNHDLLESPDLGTLKWCCCTWIDAVGMVHAIVLRIQALLLPVQTLVFSAGTEQ